MATLLQVTFWTALGLMAYAHLGYPIIMFLLASLSRPKRTDNAELPTVSLIIPAYNESKVLRDKLQNAITIDYPEDRLEILVASDGSEDETIEIAQSFGDRIIVLDFTERRGKAAVVNDAIERSSGDVICLCDANVMFQPTALKLLVARLNDPRIGAAVGDVQLQSEQSNFAAGEFAYYYLERNLQLSESQLGSMMGAEGGMYVVRREAFHPLREDTILDDLVILIEVIRKGYRTVYEPTAIAIENGTPFASDEFRRRVRVAAGAMQVLKRAQLPPLRRPIEVMQFISHKLLRWMGPIWLLAVLVTSILLWNQGAVYRVAAIGQGVFYAIGLLACWAVKLRDVRLIGIIFYFVISHVAMGWGTFLGLFNLQSVMWRRTKRKTEATSS